jgi:sugar transferase (PEP-CTERM system associated)
MLKISGIKISRATLLLVVTDSLSVALGLTAARVVSLLMYDDASPQQFYSAPTLLRLGLVVFIWDVALYYNELYDLRISKRRSVMFNQLLQALGVACLALAVLYYAAPRLSLGRDVTALAVPVILILLLGCRLALDHLGLLRHYLDRVLIVGTGEAGICLVREILSRPDFNLKVVGFLDESGENVGKSLVNPGIIGAISEVQDIAVRQRINRVVLSLAERRGCMPLPQLLRLKFAGIRVEEAHSFYEELTGRILLERLSPSWLILSDGFRKSPLLMALKRASDVVISLSALLIALPIMGLVALTIWMESGRPVLFRQRRVGLWSRQFDILKFRSMVHDAEANGPCWAVEGDSRVTRVGRFIRRYRLDELPQFFNVLRGEMSLVGPRPERPHFCELLEKEIPLFSERHSVRPGITGWAQIKYQYGSSAKEAKEKLQLDLFYIKHLSVLLDAAIILETFKVVVLGRGAK